MEDFKTPSDPIRRDSTGDKKPFVAGVLLLAAVSYGAITFLQVICPALKPLIGLGLTIAWLVAGIKGIATFARRGNNNQPVADADPGPLNEETPKEQKSYACSECGEPVGAHDALCPSCGAELEDEEEELPACCGSEVECGDTLSINALVNLLERKGVLAEKEFTDELARLVKDQAEKPRQPRSSV